MQLVEKLLISAVADADVTVRHSIFTSLHGDRGFDEYLAQADNLSAVFAALNDEVWLLDFHLHKEHCPLLPNNLREVRACQKSMYLLV